MKLRSSFLLILLLAVFPIVSFTQNKAGPRPQPILVTPGNDLSGMMADLNALFKADEEDETEKLPTRPRIAPEKNAKRDYVSTPPPKPETIPTLEHEAFELINARRAADGLPQLTWSDEVAKVARAHSQNMAGYKFFSHQGLDGLMVNGRADQAGLNKWRSIGENIAFMRGYEHPAEFAVGCWMESISHRNNLLRADWKESAIGVAQASDGSYYFTQVFLIRR
jgi:uncharacterized protein YkwD